MKNSVFLFLFFFSLSSISIAQQGVVYPGSKECSVRKSMAEYLPQKTGFPEGSPTHSYDVLKYSLDLDLFRCYSGTYPNDFKGVNTITLKVDSVLSSIELNAVKSSLTIDSVQLAGISFTQNNSLLTIILNRQYNPGEIISVKIFYSHKDVNDYAFYSSGGFVFTDSEPEGARKWFPCWDKPSDKATMELHAKVPSNVKLGSNGILADSTFSGNGDTLNYHWVSNENIATYLIVLTSRINYQLDIVYWHKLNNPNDSIPIRFYFNPGENTKVIEEMIIPLNNWFSEKFCEHPFSKNGFASLNGQFGWGGMENQTLTSIRPYGWEEGLISHEFAHQWFGDMITCATWADIWLNEGFATWCEAFWYESYGGYGAYKSTIDMYASDYLEYNPGWAISVPSWAITTPNTNVLFNYQITYEKGASVLHQLRYVLGDSLFFASLKAYCSDTNLKYKAALITDFIAKVNEVTNDDYTWFFDAWIYQPNHPDYQNSYNFTDLGNGQWQVNLFLEQTQSNPSFFQMPVEIKLTFDDGSDTTFRIMNVANYQQYSFVFDKPPTALVFDPNNNILLKTASTIVGEPDNHPFPQPEVLSQNFPNPVLENTRICFQLDKASRVRIEILDCLGKSLETPLNQFKEAGLYHFDLNCAKLKPGIYHYRLTAGDVVRTRKMVISD